jgi:hypothetical protein
LHFWHSSTLLKIMAARGELARTERPMIQPDLPDLAGEIIKLAEPDLAAWFS